MFNLVSSKPEGKEQERRLGSNSVINVINFHTSNLLFPLLHVWRLRKRVLCENVWLLPSSSAEAGEGGEGEREGEVSDLRRGDSAEIAIIRITLLGFLLHFLFDLLRSPKGSWVGAEDSPARARPADVVLQQPECNVPINLELNVAET